MMKGFRARIIIGLAGLLFLGSCGEEAGEGLDEVRSKILPERHMFSVVWTGDEMIVWGASYESSDFVGTRYSPTTDTWTMMSKTNQPFPGPFAAVWTGNEMIVWGTNYTGGRYNPATDTWTTMSTTNAPSFGNGSTALWTGTEMIIVSLSESARYNPTTDTWTSISINIPQVAVWTGTEVIYWSGSSGGRYDPTSDTWATISTTDVPSGDYFKAIWTDTEMIVWGRGGTSARYNPATDTWTTMADFPISSYGLTWVWTGTEVIILGISGGDKGGGGRYNPTTDKFTWMSEDDIPITGASNLKAVWTGNEMIVWGGGYYEGEGFDRVYYNRSGGRYDPATDTWTLLPITVG